MEIIYEPHPVTPDRKAELRSRGLIIVDARFAPADYKHPDAAKQSEVPTHQAHDDGLDDLDATALHELAKERGVEVHHKAGADKVREALRGA